MESSPEMARDCKYYWFQVWDYNVPVIAAAILMFLHMCPGAAGAGEWRRRPAPGLWQWLRAFAPSGRRIGVSRVARACAAVARFFGRFHSFC
jgi:hypothetical protein